MEYRYTPKDLILLYKYGYLDKLYIILHPDYIKGLCFPPSFYDGYDVYKIFDFPSTYLYPTDLDHSYSLDEYDYVLKEYNSSLPAEDAVSLGVANKGYTLQTIIGDSVTFLPEGIMIAAPYHHPHPDIYPRYSDFNCSMSNAPRTLGLGEFIDFNIHHQTLVGTKSRIDCYPVKLSYRTQTPYVRGLSMVCPELKEMVDDIILNHTMSSIAGNVIEDNNANIVETDKLDRLDGYYKKEKIDIITSLGLVSVTISRNLLTTCNYIPNTVSHSDNNTLKYSIRLKDHYNRINKEDAKRTNNNVLHLIPYMFDSLEVKDGKIKIWIICKAYINNTEGIYVRIPIGYCIETRKAGLQYLLTGCFFKVWTMRGVIELQSNIVPLLDNSFTFDDMFTPFSGIDIDAYKVFILDHLAIGDI